MRKHVGWFVGMLCLAIAGGLGYAWYQTPPPANSLSAVEPPPSPITQPITPMVSPKNTSPDASARLVRSEEPEDDSRPRRRVETFDQCDAMNAMGNDQPLETLRVINHYVPPGSTIHCSHQEPVGEPESPAAFVAVVYGQVRGCEEDCYANILCAIVETTDTFLYSASWHNGEFPLLLENECPVLHGETQGNTLTYCDPRTSGYTHPVTQSALFRSVSSGTTDIAPFRYCFWSTP